MAWREGEGGLVLGVVVVGMDTVSIFLSFSVFGIFLFLVESPFEYLVFPTVYYKSI